MKKNQYLLHIAALLAAGLLLFSCAIEPQNIGTLVIRMPGTSSEVSSGSVNARAVSDGFLSTLSYRIDCEGSGITRNAGAGESVSILLAAGTWDITVTAFNAAKQEIGKTTTPVKILAGETSHVKLPVALDTSGCEITQFKIISPVNADGIIDQQNGTILVSVPAGTDVSNMQFSLVHTGAHITHDSGSALDFSNSQIFTVTAEDGTIKTYTVQITAENTSSVISVNILPSSPSVAKGETLQFTAEVITTGNASTDVTWGLEGDYNSGTTISATGLLTVAADEIRETITVKAISVFDNTKTGTVAVQVIVE